ncbi:hypothetical protein Tco_1301607 [Tanacetum coccineum]
MLRPSNCSKVPELLCHEIDDAILDPLFVTQVMEPLQIQQLHSFSTMANVFGTDSEPNSRQKGVGVGGRGLKDKQHGSASNTAKGTGVAFSTVDEHVNTPSVNLEKPLEPNTGYHINDTANVEENGLMRAISIYLVQATSDGLLYILCFFLENEKLTPRLVLSMGLDSINGDWPWSSYVREMIELRADEELKDTIMEAMPKLRHVSISKDDDDLGYNERELKSSGKGSSHVVHGSSGNTPIIDKIDKLERQILNVKFNETKRDDDYDPYDEDLYESHDMSDHLQAIYEKFRYYGSWSEEIDYF